MCACVCVRVATYQELCVLLKVPFPGSSYALQAVQTYLGRCFNAAGSSWTGTYNYTVCTNVTGIMQRGYGGSWYIGRYLGWSNARQEAAFANGDICISDGTAFKRAAYLFFACGAKLVVAADETGERMEVYGCGCQASNCLPQLMQCVLVL